jgi:hypothetical protein
LKDVRFADGACTPVAGTPVMVTPTGVFAAASPFSMVHGIRPMGPTCHTVTHSSFATQYADPFHLNDATPTGLDDPDTLQPRRRYRRSKTLGAEISTDISVSVVAPGGGTGINSSVYASLGRKDNISLNYLGHSRAPYDRYPESWDEEGGPPPNLETFALDVVAQNRLDNVDCLVAGSRGGQVVLPTLWKMMGVDVPPAVVMNGGCAMSLPSPVQWPEDAVTFLLLGGHDYFKGQRTIGEYLEDTQRRVPRANATTAILLVHEMTHMPQAPLLAAILYRMIRAVTSWKSSGCVPFDSFRTILTSLLKGGWSGMLSFKTAPGDGWEIESFP